jgi:fibronectin type 3 domain-containing protein
MKNLMKIVALLIILCPYSNLWADGTQPSFPRAVGGNGVVTLSWSPPDREVQGYWVYRALPDGDFQRISTQPVKEAFYRDMGLINGQYYWYLITAIDKEGKEGTPSRKVWVLPSSQAKPQTGY